MRLINLVILVICLSIFCSPAIYSQDSSLIKELNSIKKYTENLKHRLDEIERRLDDLIWYQRLENVAFIDKVYMYSRLNGKKRIRMHRVREIL